MVENMQQVATSVFNHRDHVTLPALLPYQEIRCTVIFTCLLPWTSYLLVKIVTGIYSARQ